MSPWFASPSDLSPESACASDFSAVSGGGSSARPAGCARTALPAQAHSTADYRHLELLHENLMYAVTGDKIATFFT